MEEKHLASPKDKHFLKLYVTKKQVPLCQTVHTKCVNIF